MAGPLAARPGLTDAGADQWRHHPAALFRPPPVVVVCGAQDEEDGSQHGLVRDKWMAATDKMLKGITDSVIPPTNHEHV